jgi:hypothetical protein
LRSTRRSGKSGDQHFGEVALVLGAHARAQHRHPRREVLRDAHDVAAVPSVIAQLPQGLLAVGV